MKILNIYKKYCHNVIMALYENVRIAIISLIVLEVGHLVFYTNEIKVILNILKYENTQNFVDILNNIKDNYQGNYLIFLIFALILILISSKIKSIFVYIIKILKTKRYDIVFTIICLVIALIYRNTKLISNSNVIYIIIFALLILVFVITIQICLFSKLEAPKGFLLSDKPLSGKEGEEDVLNYKKLAKQFAENIWNEGVKNNLIFSIESDWGNGKTSFLNMVREDEIIIKNCIIFEFEAWYFSDESDLLSKFLNELKNTLNNQYYLPKLSKQFDNLLKVLSENGIKNILGINFNATSETLEDINKSINESLKEIPKKLIIIIDDIDRLPMDKAKILFKIINLCRNFHNTSYILCYDNENFNSIDEVLIKTKNKDGILETEDEIDNKNIREYLEKIVNVKYSLIPDINLIKQYFIDTFLKKEILEFSDNSIKGIREGVDNLFKLENFNIFGKHLRNIRKIKRLYNNFLIGHYGNKNLLKNIFDTKNNGLQFDVYIKLSLLKMFYDNLYNDIVIDNELNKKEQFLNLGDELGSKYSIKYEYPDRGYKTKDTFNEYIKKLSLNQKNIISNIFPQIATQELENHEHLGIGTRLNDYLNFLHSIENIDFNTIISNHFDEFINNDNLSGIIHTIRKEQQEKGIAHFLNTFEKNITSLNEQSSKEKIDSLLNYILDNFHEYSINSLASCEDNIARILDKVIRHENSDENCINVIGNYLYSKGEIKGIIDKFFDSTWGIKGLLNALRLRKYATNSGHLWNLQRGIVGEKYELNSERTLQYEKISRYIYNLFREKYINDRVNIFKQIQDLNEDDFVHNDGVRVNWEFNRIGITSFLIYQLSNDVNGIGYYDIDDTLEYDKQSNGVKKELNSYYFNFCFNGDIGIKYFVEYIFEFIYNPSNDEVGLDCKEYSIRYERTINEYNGAILNVFEEDKLREFIENRKEDIESHIKKHDKDIFDGFNNVQVTYGFGRKLFNNKLSPPTTIENNESSSREVTGVSVSPQISVDNN